MRLGLITDIHEDVEMLRIALERFDKERVDQVVVIGDVVELGERLAETCRLLADAGAMGVWGNHDFGLCVDPGDEMLRRFPSEVFDYLGSLQPHLEVAGCHFSHVEPWLNPHDPAELWYFQGPPDEPWKLARVFDAAANRVLFAGHFHRWLLATPDGISDWRGEGPIRLLDDQRYFVIVGALCNGSYAVFDADSSVLMPFHEEPGSRCAG